MSKLNDLTHRIRRRLLRLTRSRLYRRASPVRPAPQGEWRALPRQSAPPLVNTDSMRVRFANGSGSAEVLASLRRYGIAIVDGFFSAEMIESAASALRGKFGPDNCQFIPAAHDSRMILLRDAHLARAKAETAAFDFVSTHPLVAAAGRDFFGDDDWRNTALYGLVYLDERKGDVHYHMDASACLKALVYLSDVDSEADGPFFLDVGSHREGYYRMMTHYYEGTKHPYELPEDEVRFPAKVLGKAGTCILFNSIVVHRAGEVAQQHKRLSLTYFFDRPYASDNDMRIPPFLYSHRHQSEERPYKQ